MVRGVQSAYTQYPSYAEKPVTNHEKRAEESGVPTVSWADVMAGTAPSASFVVCSSPEDRAAMQAYFSNAFSNAPALSSENDQPMADLSTVLTDEEWESLSQKYDPSNMTQQEYTALLAELHDAGLLSDEDLDMLSVCKDGHSSCIDVGGIHLSAVPPELMSGHCITSLTNNADFPGGQPAGFASGKEYCNVLAMSAWEKAFQYYDPERSEWLPTRKAQAFRRLDAILQEIVSHQ